MNCASGYRVAKNTRNWLILALLLFFVFLLNGQTTYKGYVTTASEARIANTIIVLYDIDSVISNYSYSDNFGRFNVTLNNNIHYIGFSKLGYKKHYESVSNKILYPDSVIIVLDTLVEMLPEAIISTQKLYFVVEGDTVTYNVKSFVTETTLSLKDILDNIPSFEVDKNGAMRFNGKPINKLLLDGKDVVTGATKDFLKAVSVDDLKNIQVISNYRDPGSVITEALNGLVVNINTKSTGDIKGILNLSLGASKSYNLVNSIYSSKAKYSTFLNLNANNSYEETISQMEYAALSTDLSSLLQSSLSGETNLKGYSDFAIPQNISKNKDEMLSLRDERMWNHGLRTKFSLMLYRPKRNYNYDYFRFCNCENNGFSGRFQEFNYGNRLVVNLKATKWFQRNYFLEVNMPLNTEIKHVSSYYSIYESDDQLRDFKQTNKLMSFFPEIILGKKIGNESIVSLNFKIGNVKEEGEIKNFSRENSYGMSNLMRYDSLFLVFQHKKQELQIFNSYLRFSKNISKITGYFNVGIQNKTLNVLLNSSSYSSSFRNWSINNNNYFVIAGLDMHLGKYSELKVDLKFDKTQIAQELLNYKHTFAISPSVKYEFKKDALNRILVNYRRHIDYKDLEQYYPLSYIINDQTVYLFNDEVENTFGVRDILTFSINHGFNQSNLYLSLSGFINHNLNTVMEKLKMDYFENSLYVVPENSGINFLGHVVVKSPNYPKTLIFLLKYNLLKSKTLSNNNLEEFVTQRGELLAKPTLYKGNDLNLKVNYGLAYYSNKFQKYDRFLENFGHSVGLNFEYNFRDIKMEGNYIYRYNKSVRSLHETEFKISYNMVNNKTFSPSIFLVTKNPYYFKGKSLSEIRVQEYYFDFLSYEYKIAYVQGGFAFRLK